MFILTSLTILKKLYPLHFDAQESYDRFMTIPLNNVLTTKQFAT